MGASEADSRLEMCNRCRQSSQHSPGNNTGGFGLSLRPKGQAKAVDVYHTRRTDEGVHTQSVLGIPSPLRQGLHTSAVVRRRVCRMGGGMSPADRRKDRSPPPGNNRTVSGHPPTCGKIKVNSRSINNTFRTLRVEGWRASPTSYLQSWSLTGINHEYSAIRRNTVRSTTDRTSLQ